MPPTRQFPAVVMMGNPQKRRLAARIFKQSRRETQIKRRRSTKPSWPLCAWDRLGLNDPVKKSSKPLPVDEQIDEGTREHFFSKHLLNTTEQSQVGNKTEKATNQGKKHSAMWTKHVSVVLPKSKKGHQKKREQIKSVRSAAVKRE